MRNRAGSVKFFAVIADAGGQMCRTHPCTCGCAPGRKCSWVDTDSSRRTPRQCMCKCCGAHICQKYKWNTYNLIVCHKEWRSPFPPQKIYILKYTHYKICKVRTIEHNFLVFITYFLWDICPAYQQNQQHVCAESSGAAYRKTFVFDTFRKFQLFVEIILQLGKGGESERSQRNLDNQADSIAAISGSDIQKFVCFSHMTNQFANHIISN